MLALQTQATSLKISFETELRNVPDKWSEESKDTAMKLSDTNIQTLINTAEHLVTMLGGDFSGPPKRAVGLGDPLAFRS
jgi:hypothetical protein